MISPHNWVVWLLWHHKKEVTWRIAELPDGHGKVSGSLAMN